MNIQLIPPLLSESHIDQKISCIRAHRERIFNLSTEQLNKKILFHNYGHGGAGWTFLFGCVNESVRQFEEALQENPSLQGKPICVIGAGCYGLLTAIMLAAKGYAVRIVAKDTHTISSYKAAGFFFPRWRKSSTAQEKQIFLSRGIESYKTYLDIYNGTHPFIKKGPQIVPAYYGLDIDPGFAPYIESNLMQEPKEVTIDFGNGKQYAAREYQTIFINPADIMQELQRAKDELSITITQQEISSFAAVPEDIIFNCAGLGAKALTQDTRVIPIQGHLITLKNQSRERLHYMINMKVVMQNPDGSMRDELIYFAPKDEGILGITFIRNQDSLAANQHEFDRLLQRSRDFFGT
ncbi:hypothetical protein BH09DEP1_BH09DEP1_6440 [soil metagenome]